MLEVLAARHRLGESFWTFPRRHRRTAERLSARGLVWMDLGNVENTIRVGLTEEGLAEAISPDYLSPAERKWLQADPEKVLDAVRKIMEAGK